MSAPRVFGFDLIRAVGAVFVLIAHSFLHLPAIPPALRGVFDTPGIMAAEMFFSLSGFLVGRILIADFRREVSFLSLFHFWGRRWLRTLPLYFLFLLVSAVSIYLLRGVEVTSLIPRYFYFFQNFYKVPPDFFGQSWSLSIEEWFYLLCPAMVYFLYSRIKDLDRSVLIVFLLFSILPLLLRIERAVIAPDDSWRHLFRKGVIFRLDAVISGVGMAWLFEFRPWIWQKIEKKMWKLGFLLLGICAVVIQFYELANTFLGKTIFFSALPMGCALVLPWFLSLSRPRNRFIAGLVQHLALLSYAIYLANNEVSLVLRNPQVVSALHLENNFPRSVFLFLSFSFLIALAVNRLVERPILRLRDRKVPQGTQVSFGVGTA